MDAPTARALLVAEARRLGLLAHGTVAHPGGEILDPPEGDPDLVAAGADLIERELELAVGAGIDGERRDVVDAFVRLEAGTYGLCLGCGQPIDDERLEAVPATRFCVDHERWAETALEASGVDGTDQARDPAELVRAEAQTHFELLVDDDAPDDPVDQLGAEERAVHLREG